MKNNFLFLFLFSLPFIVSAQNLELEDHWWVTDQSVNAIVQKGDTVYLGGMFNNIGPNKPYGVPFDPTTGMPNLTFAKPNNAVHVVLPDGAGGWFIGGAFTQVAGQPRDRLARINSDGTLHAWNPGVDDDVHALAVSNGVVYVGGYFSNLGGQPRENIGAVDAATGIATGFNPNAEETVFAIQVVGNTVYVGGTFSSIGGQNRNNIAALDATTGTATAFNPNANGTVSTITIANNIVFAGGGFTNIGGNSRNRIAALNATTGAATPFNPNSNGPVDDLLLNGNTLYVAGGFSNIGGVSRNNIASFDVVTGNLNIFNPNANSFVNNIALNSNNNLYVAGNFTTIGGQSRLRIAELDAVTGAATAFSCDTNSTIESLAVSNGALYAGGYFTSMGVVGRSNIAALNAITGMPTDFNPAPNGYVFSLAVNENILYVGGQFQSIGGQDRNNIAALDITTAMVTPFNPNANDDVLCLAVADGIVYAGGTFTTIGGQIRKRIAALDAITGLATAFNPNADNTVYALAIKDGLVYAGGAFQAVHLQNRSRIVALNVVTGAPTTFNPGANNNVRALAISGNTLYAGGEFTIMNGQTRNRIAALNLPTGTLTAFTASANDVVRALAVSGSILYVGGIFTTINGQSSDRFAALNAITGISTALTANFNHSTYPVVYTIYTNAGTVYVGGLFSWLNGHSRSGLAVFNEPAPTITTGVIAPTGFCNGAAVTIPFIVTGNFFDGNIFSAQLSDASGSFASPTVIGSLAGSTGGTINSIIPPDAASGSGYRIRVIASDPAVVGNDNQSNISISSITATAVVSSAIECNGGTGTITVNAAGGTGTFEYAISPAFVYTVDNTFASVPAGTYTIMVRNNLGCEIQLIDVVLTEPAPLTVTTTQTNVSCNGATDGTASVVVAGGTGNYTYIWIPSGGTGATASGLTAGNYNVTVTDANGCAIVESFTVADPPAIIINTEPEDAVADIGSTVAFNVDATNAESYQWQISVNNNNWQNLSDGGTTPQYSGTTTNNLTVLNVPSSYNGYQYRVSVINGENCVTESATATLTVNTLMAVNDDFSGTIVEEGTGGIVGDVTQNDLMNGSAVLDTNIIITVVDNNGLTDLAIDNEGLLLVPASAQEGTYIIKYTICEADNITNCSTAEATTVVSPSLANKTFDNEVVSIYPNPTDAEFNIKVPADLSFANIRVFIYDVNGRLLKQKTIKDGTTKEDITSFEDGVYILKLVLEKRSITRKIIKK